MANWRETIDIGSALRKHEDEDFGSSDPVPEGLLDNIREELKKSRLLPRSLRDSLDTVETIEDLDDWLEDLYDSADHSKVWVAG